MFKGHQLYKINDEWVFNLTVFKGYNIEIDKRTGQVISYKLAYKLEKVQGDYAYEKYMDVPMSVLRKTVEVVESYTKEALLEDEYS